MGNSNKATATVVVTPDTPTPIQGHPVIKGIVAAVAGAIAIHWAGTEVWLGAVFGFMFFLVGHVNGHAYGYRLGREEKEKVEADSQPEHESNEGGEGGGCAC